MRWARSCRRPAGRGYGQWRAGTEPGMGLNMRTTEALQARATEVMRQATEDIRDGRWRSAIIHGGEARDIQAILEVRNTPRAELAAEVQTLAAAIRLYLAQHPRERPGARV